MKLWLVERDGRKVGYDEWDSWIIVHDSAEGAMTASGYQHEKGIAATEVGIAADHLPAEHVVLGSFNAG